MLMEWTKRSQAVIDHYLKAFESGGPISMLRFIECCQKQEIFNVLKIREVAKQTAVLSNANAHLNAESLADRDLFQGRLSEVEVKSVLSGHLS
jgi:hypothetical protein